MAGPQSQGANAPTLNTAAATGNAAGLPSQAIVGGRLGDGPGQVNGSPNLTNIVLEYLAKRGYSRTEAMLRAESAFADRDGRVHHQRAEDTGGEKYTIAMNLLRGWIEQNLEIYKPELRRLLWPVFVYSFLNLAVDCYPRDCEKFYEKWHELFAGEHEDDLRQLSAIRLPEHVHASQVAQIYRGNKYRISLTSTAFFNLISFLESKEREGGTVVLSLLQNSCKINTVSRGTIDPHSLAGILQRASDEQDMPAENEGIPGHHPGSANLDDTLGALAKLKLGPLPMDPDLVTDVQAELEEEDIRNPPRPGQPSLAEEFDRRIKREPSDDAPLRSDVPLPPSQMRDVTMEVLKVKENRDRFGIEGKTNGAYPGVSTVMYTFHNTYDSVNCLDFSDDNLMVAAGTNDSYIRVWSLDGSPLPSIMSRGPQDPPSSSSRRLIGHSGPVYAVSFSPAIANYDAAPDAPPTTPTYLLSASADKTIRLWSIDAWQCLVVYKGHDDPIWDVKWGPHGHYFVSGGRDRVARLWSTDHIGYLRMFVGHDQDVDVVGFHPNSAYVFTASSDKTVRMWSVTNGVAVRIFSGHTANITSLACSRDGKTLASADDSGVILLWDLATGRRVKRMRGHGRGGIWSLSWSVESNMLVSGGADCTVRLWDVSATSDGPTAAAAGSSNQNRLLNGVEGAGAGGGIVPKIEGASNGVTAGVAQPGTGAGVNARPSSSAGHNNNTAVGGITSTTTPGPINTGAGVGATTTTTTTTATSTAAGMPSGVSGAATAAPGSKKRNKDVVVTPDQIGAFLTKKSPVYHAKFSRMNLVIAGGAFLP